MMQSLGAYAPLILAMGAMAALFLIQVSVLDVAGIAARHEPGTPVPSDHGLFLFRATRAHANTNEGIAAFILLALFGMLSSASAAWLDAAAWIYVGGRAAYAVFYYADRRTLRSVAFSIAFAALWAMLLIGALPWFSA